MAAVMLTGGLLGYTIDRTHPFSNCLHCCQLYTLHTWAVGNGGTLGIPLYVNTHYRTVSTCRLCMIRVLSQCTTQLDSREFRAMAI